MYVKDNLAEHLSVLVNLEWTTVCPGQTTACPAWTSTCPAWTNGCPTSDTKMLEIENFFNAQNSSFSYYY